MPLLVSRFEVSRIKNSRINPQRESILRFHPPRVRAPPPHCRLIPDTRPRFTRGREPISPHPCPHHSYIYLIRRFVGRVRIYFRWDNGIRNRIHRRITRIRIPDSNAWLRQILWIFFNWISLWRMELIIFDPFDGSVNDISDHGCGWIFSTFFFFSFSVVGKCAY